MNCPNCERNWLCNFKGYVETDNNNNIIGREENDVIQCVKCGYKLNELETKLYLDKFGLGPYTGNDSLVIKDTVRKNKNIWKKLKKYNSRARGSRRR
jgi:hypothetical protein